MKAKAVDNISFFNVLLHCIYQRKFFSRYTNIQLHWSRLNFCLTKLKALVFRVQGLPVSLKPLNCSLNHPAVLKELQDDNSYKVSVSKVTIIKTNLEAEFFVALEVNRYWRSLVFYRNCGRQSGAIAQLGEKTHKIKHERWVDLYSKR